MFLTPSERQFLDRVLCVLLCACAHLHFLTAFVDLSRLTHECTTLAISFLLAAVALQLLLSVVCLYMSRVYPDLGWLFNATPLIVVLVSMTHSSLRFRGSGASCYTIMLTAIIKTLTYAVVALALDCILCKDDPNE